MRLDLLGIIESAMRSALENIDPENTGDRDSLGIAINLVRMEMETQRDVPVGNVADDACKLLDNGRSIVLYRNALGSYTAVAVRNGSDGSRFLERAIRPELKADRETDDFTPAKALHRLTEKALAL